MNKIVATPLKEINGVRFGMKRDEVRKIFLSFKGEFKKTPFSKTTTDDFGFCHVFYNANDECEAIEVFDAEVYVDGTLVFPSNIETVKALFHDLVEEDDGFIIKSQSIGIYAPYGKFESILFGIPNYYE